MPSKVRPVNVTPNNQMLFLQQKEECNISKVVIGYNVHIEVNKVSLILDRVLKQ